MTATCIDLKERFGDKYRIENEEPATAWNTDPWYFIIPCRNNAGHIYPYGGNMLGFASNGRHPKMCKQIASLPGAEVWQDGDDGQNVIFPVDVFDQVAQIVHLKQKKQVSEEERQRLREMGFQKQKPQ